jgi:flagellar biogenesis protein FliO
VRIRQTISAYARRMALGRSALLATVASLQLCGAATVAADESISISPRGLQSSTPITNSDVPSWSRTTVALGVTLGIAIVGLVIARRFMPGLSNESRAGLVQILSQAPLGTRGVVYVVRCGPRVLIVGATANNISTLAEIADPDEIDEFRRLNCGKSSTLPRARSGAQAAAPAAELKGQLHGMLDKIEGWNAQR